MDEIKKEDNLNVKRVSCSVRKDLWNKCKKKHVSFTRALELGINTILKNFEVNNRADELEEFEKRLTRIESRINKLNEIYYNIKITKEGENNEAN